MKTKEEAAKVSFGVNIASDCYLLKYYSGDSEVFYKYFDNGMAAVDAFMLEHSMKAKMHGYTIGVIYVVDYQGKEKKAWSYWCDVKTFEGVMKEGWLKRFTDPDFKYQPEVTVGQYYEEE